ncbi:DNA cytosine methyltransferase [Streptomyces sp. HUCO-GS316]|uniref:DNA cytosine methyltransferase n=1 Tax=Streptomyces sp. HUCO-GS316 TaxID=2692198 RepID=UPI00136BD340|nr:DNA cytosine methyltransferase [Streptomyces sp. HUCO-GS316]
MPDTPGRVGSLCTGYGGLDTAVREAMGCELAWVADNDPGASLILAAGHPGVPNLGDIRTVDWHAVLAAHGRPYVVTGGYPCQPFSFNGRRKGAADARHLWPHIVRALRVLRPRYGFFENVAGHLSLGFDTVLRDLASLGLDAEWCTVRADEVRLSHRRRRLFVLTADPAWTPDPAPAADPVDVGGHGPGSLGTGRPQPPARHRDPGGRPFPWGKYEAAVRRHEAVLGRPAPDPADEDGRVTTRFMEWHMAVEEGRVTDVPGLSRAQQIRALGNGVVWLQAAAALDILLPRLTSGSIGEAA